jgi:hypothetical protein
MASALSVVGLRSIICSINLQPYLNLTPKKLPKSLNECGLQD